MSNINNFFKYVVVHTNWLICFSIRRHTFATTTESTVW